MAARLNSPSPTTPVGTSPCWFHESRRFGTDLPNSARPVFQFDDPPPQTGWRGSIACSGHNPTSGGFLRGRRDDSRMQDWRWIARQATAGSCSACRRLSPRKNWLHPRHRLVLNASVMSQTHPLTTTAFELPGYRTVKGFGGGGAWCGALWCGRARSSVTSGRASRTIFGGQHLDLHVALRADAGRRISTKCSRMRANWAPTQSSACATDATEIGAGINEVICYGTAVRVEPMA